MRSCKVKKPVRLPIETTLTFYILVGALRKLPTVKIREAVHTLIEELDIRHGDPDFEPDPDFEAEPDEMDHDRESILADLVISGDRQLEMVPESWTGR
jgi:hypothetical protein